MAFLKFELRQLILRGPVLAILFLLVLALGFTQLGVSDLKNSQAQKAVFQDFESKKVDQFFNYKIYSSYGFRLIFQSDPFSVFFFNSVTVPDLNAYADGGERLNIYKAIYGKNVFEMRQNWFTDYSGVMQLIGGLFALFYGYIFQTSAEYLRMLSSIGSKKEIFRSILFARMKTLFLVLLFVTACSFLLVLLNGVIIPIDIYALTSLFSSFLLLSFFFSVGFFFGLLKSKIAGVTSALMVWAIVIFIIPTVINIIISNKASEILPIYQLEIEKLKIYMDFENDWIKKEGVLNIGDKKTDKVKNYMMYYKENGLKNIQALENKIIDQMEANARLFQFLSSLFPTTHYQSVNNELSSRGYDELIKFCRYSLKQKVDFVLGVIEKEYFSNYSKVEPLFKGEDNVYKAHPGLPKDFLLGVLFNILWILAFLIPAYPRFKKNLLELEEKKKKDPDIVEVKLDTVDVNSFQADNDLVTRQLYNYLSDEPGEFKKRGYSLKVTVDDKVLNMAEQKKEFLFLCHPSELPGDTKTGNYLDFIMDLMDIDKTKREDLASRFDLASIRSTKLKRLDDEQMGKVYQAILDMKQYPIYLFGDTFRKMGWEFCHPLVEKMIRLTNDGSLVIHIFENMDTIYRKKSKSCWFHKTNLWINQVIAYSGRHDDEPC